VKRILIVGAGGFGREVYFWMLQHPDCGRVWEIGGFLDDNPHALDGFDFPAGIVGSVKEYSPAADDLLVCGIGRAKPRRPVCEMLKAKGARFMTFVHPSAIIGGKVELGEGVFICPGVVISCCIKIGEFVMLNLGTTVGHDATIGAYSTLSAHCDVTGYCSVGETVFMGSRASLIPGSKVGDNTIIGAGAVVIRPVKPGTTVIGNPARELAG
jgi:sugar O-acyltransferase (sialic acid O-acetyltransferase NeuD family)